MRFTSQWGTLIAAAVSDAGETFAQVSGSRPVEWVGCCCQGMLMRSAKDAKRNGERKSRIELGFQLSLVPGVVVAAERAIRLVGLAADEDPEVGLLGVPGLREVAKVCEEHQVRGARSVAWTWAQIATALEVSPQACINATRPDSPPPSHQGAEPPFASSRRSVAYWARDYRTAFVNDRGRLAEVR